MQPEDADTPGKIAFEVRDGYLFVRVSGSIEPDPIRAGLTAIREQAQKAGLTRILVNALGLCAPRAEIHRFMAGEAIAEILPYPFKTAVLCKPEMINKFAETTAVNRGAQLLICGDEGQALGWLLGSTTP